jgi:hypothetical protein
MFQSTNQIIMDRYLVVHASGLVHPRDFRELTLLSKRIYQA